MITFIEHHRARFGIESICRLLPIAPSTYYPHRAVDRNPDLASDDPIGESGAKKRYEIYFVVSRSSKNKSRLNSYIQSAYERTQNHGAKPKKSRRPVSI